MSDLTPDRINALAEEVAAAFTALVQKEISLGLRHARFLQSRAEAEAAKVQYQAIRLEWELAMGLATAYHRTDPESTDRFTFG